jgi:hypothetical protein
MQNVLPGLFVVPPQGPEIFGFRAMWGRGRKKTGPRAIRPLWLGLNAPRSARESKSDGNRMAFMTSSPEEQKQI